MRMRKLVLKLSLAQILPEKINKKMLSLNNLGFIDVLSTVHSFGCITAFCGKTFGGSDLIITVLLDLESANYLAYANANFVNIYA